MKIKWVKVLSNKWKIVWGDKWSEGEEIFGLTKELDQTIYIHTRPPEEKQYSTLFHELIHAVDMELKIGLRERQVVLLESGLVQLIRENPQFIKELMRMNPKLMDEE